MDMKSAETIYMRHQIMALTPLKLTIWILHEALKAIKLGITALQNNDIAEQNKQLQIAQQLVLEAIPLMNDSVDAGDKLKLIIDYINRKLIEANINKDVLLLREIEQLLEELYSAFNSTSQVS